MVIPTFNVTTLLNGTTTYFDGIDNSPATPANDKNPLDTSAHGFYTVYTPAYANEVRVTALAQGPWIFIDEVKFDGEVVGIKVPEPSLAGLLLLGVLSIGARRLKSMGSNTINLKGL